MKPELAYLLGYFYADGCCHIVTKTLKSGILANYPCITLEIVTSDSRHIKECLDICNIKYTTWARFRNNSKNEQTTFRISASCNFHKLFTSIMQNKQDMSFAISLIPIELHHQFIKGFFDGDGCISISKIIRHNRLYFYGSYEQNWEVLIDKFKLLQIKFTYQQIVRKGGKHKSSHIVVSNKDGILKFFLYLYQEANFDFGLLRKYEKLKDVYSHVSNRPKPILKYNDSTEKIKIYS